MHNVNYNPDVLTCLANLSNDEVFTPPNVANAVLDMLPKDLWKDKSTTFLDPVCKSGIFLREIAKRLMVGLEKQIPNQQKRINHIFTKQLYGIAITELTSLLSRRSVYCSKAADGKYSVCDSFENKQGNILFGRIEHTWKNKQCTYCGASQEVYERSAELETHAYQFIHTDKPDKLFNMKFDVIIGNPPYQLDTGGSGRQAKPIYQHFVSQAKKLNPRYLAMIMPSRWFAGGMGLNEFREEMLNDDQIRTIVDYIDASECFPGVDIAGGICYFLWEKGSKGDCVVVNKILGKEYRSTRPLNEFEILVRHGQAIPILKKVNAQNEDKLTNIISATRPFGLKTSDRPDGKGDIHLYSSGGSGAIASSRVTAGHDMISKWKIITSKASHDHGGQPDRSGSRRVLSKVELLEPNHVCTESYIVLGAFDTKKEAQNCLKYVKTRFVRFLVSIPSFSQDITRERFCFVPIVNFKKEWSDKDLYKKYDLKEEEISFIESMIRSMD